jgi:hypothetical protein
MARVEATMELVEVEVKHVPAAGVNWLLVWQVRHALKFCRSAAANNRRSLHISDKQPVPRSESLERGTPSGTMGR